VKPDDVTTFEMMGMNHALSRGQHAGGGDEGNQIHLPLWPARLVSRRLLIVTFLLLGFALGVGAAEVRNISDIGPHQPILTVRKNVNPQNLMVIYTKTDADGRFLGDPNSDRPVLDFYWLMDGKTYKPVNGLIKTEIRKRFAPRWSSGGRATHFVITMKDLKEVNSDISEPKVDVYARETDDVPTVEAQMNLGPSDRNMRIKLSSIQTAGRAFPPTVHSVTLKGEEIANGISTGRKVARKYEAR
jgi:hypothetical protein